MIEVDIAVFFFMQYRTIVALQVDRAAFLTGMHEAWGVSSGYPVTEMVHIPVHIAVYFECEGPWAKGAGPY